jgi:hypothetical protein
VHAGRHGGGGGGDGGGDGGGGMQNKRVKSHPFNSAHDFHLHMRLQRERGRGSGAFVGSCVCFGPGVCSGASLSGPVERGVWALCLDSGGMRQS